MDKSLRDLMEIIHFTERVCSKIHGQQDEGEIYRTIKEEFAKSKRYTASIMLLTDDGSKLTLAETSLPPGKLKTLEKATGLMREGYKVDLNKSSIYSQVIREGKTIQVKISDILDEILPRPLTHLISKTLGYEKKLSILTPLTLHGKIIGAFGMSSTDLFEHFIPSVKNLAQHISTTLELSHEYAEHKRAEKKLRYNEEHFRSLIENSSDIIAVVDRDLTIRYQSPSLERILGYKPEEIIGKVASDFVHPEDVSQATKIFGQLIQNPGVIQSTEYRARHKDGSWRNLEAISKNLLDDPAVAGIVINYRDITERKRMEEALRESERHYHLLADNVKDVIWTMNLNLQFTYVSPSVTSLRGYSVEETMNQRLEDYLTPASVEVARKALEEELAIENTDGRDLSRSRRLELERICKDGTTIWTETKMSFLRNGDGRVVGILGVSRDITERKKAEQIQLVLYKIAKAVNATKDLADLFKSIRENLDTIVDTTNFYIALYDKKSGNISLPYQVDEKDKFISFLAGKTLTSYVIKKNKSLLATEEVKEKLVQAGEVETIGTPSKVWLGVPLKTEKGTIGAVVVQSYKDSSTYDERDLEILKFVSGQIAIAIERKKTQQALRRSEERYRDLVEKEKDIIYTLDIKGNITSSNAAAKKILGYQPEGLIGKNFVDIVSKEVLEKTLKDFHDLLKTGEITAETVLLDKRGKPHFVEYSSTVVKENDKVVGARGIVRDITERKRAEEKLKLFSQSVDSSIDGIAMGNLQNRITYVNEAFVRMFGYSKEELIGKEITFIYFEDQIPKLKNALEATMEGGWRGELIGRRKNGQLFPLAVSSSIVMNDEEKTIAQMASHRDITEQKRVEEELKRHRCHLQELVKERTEELRRRDAILEAVSFAAEQFLKATSQNEGIQKALERLGKATGVSRVYIFENHISKDGTILGSQRHEWVASGIVPQIDNLKLQDLSWLALGAARWEKTLSRGGIIHGHIREFSAIERDLLAPQGIKSLMVVPIFVGQEWWGSIGFDECLTEREWSVTEIDALKAAADILGAAVQRQQSEERLRESEQKYRKTIDSMGDAIHLVDTDLRFVLFNSAFEQWNMELGLETDVRGRTVFEVFPFLPDKVRDEYRQVFDTGKVLVTEETITVGDREFITETRKIPVLEKSRISGVISVIRDITERKRIEEQVRQYSEQLEELAEKRAARILELEREKRESEKLAATGRMAARIAHEINNPLGGIKNSFLLIKDAIPEDHPYYKYVGLIERETDRIARIVSQMFDLYRPDQETSREFSIKETIGDVVALLEVDCRESGIHLEIDISDVSVTVILPEALVRQVLYNVLQNAIEASPPEGVVRIEAKVVDEILTITISDQGSGIPEGIRPQIFEPFFTTKSNLKTGGLGLGLSVSKNLVEAMKGSLDFESKPGQGVLFRITLPVKILRKEVQTD